MEAAGKMARRVRVASRAIRRGRKLRARTSEVPPLAPSADPTPDDDIESGEVISRRSKYSRPPAPRLDFVLGAATAADDDVAADADDDGDDLDDDDRDAHVDAERDPNATTLVSASSSARMLAEKSTVGVEVADDELPSTRRVEADVPAPGFVPEQDEPPLSVPPSYPSSRAHARFRDSDETLAPVVDDLAFDDDDEDVGPELLSAAETRRRRTLRRAVGIFVALIGLVTVGLATKATIGAQAEGDAPAVPAVQAAAPQAAAIDAQAASAPEATPAIAEPTPAAATEETATSDDGETASDVEAPAGDYATVSKKTLALLNERKFEDALLWAQRLIDLQPNRAFGYRCLGAALQDLGRIADAREAYSKCVTVATEGEVEECTALGGAKRR